MTRQKKKGKAGSRETGSVFKKSELKKLMKEIDKKRLLEETIKKDPDALKKLLKKLKEEEGK